MKCIPITLPNTIIELKLVSLSDWHYGSQECNLKQIKSQIKEIQSDPNLYCILGGDLIENATKTSVGDSYSSLSPMEQIKFISNLLQPIKDRILGAVSGNHERRTLKGDGIDITYFIMQALGLLNRYDSNAILLFLRFGQSPYLKNRKGLPRQMCYTVYATHGASSGRTIGAKANALNRLGDITDADICFVAHTHQPLTFKDKTYRTDYANNSIQEKITTYINSASTLDYQGYPEVLSLKPSCFDNPMAVLDGAKHKVKVVI